MIRSLTVLTAYFVLMSALTASAQEVPQFPSPEKEHQWLKQFEGQWEMKAEARMGPNQPVIECTGQMASRMLGEFWVINEMTNNMAGMSMKGIQTIGYNAKKKKYVGTWVDSVSDFIWKYEGTIDDSGKKLTLAAEGPNLLEPGKTSKYRDAYEFKSKDHIIATSSMQTDDGKWVSFMTGDLQRKK